MKVDTQPGAPQRVQELWFEDGNLVIQAGNSQFRVYRGILAARSPVFQDMLSFPQPPDSELVDGCPIVRLTDAEAEITDFLKAIFVPEYFPAFPAPTKFHIVVGCLRLSHKYEVDYLRRRALIHLSSRYRTTLSEWDARAYAVNLDFSSAQRVMSWLAPPGDSFNICVVQLAREVDALWVLPVAFYDLSSAFNTPENLFTPGFSMVKLRGEVLRGAVYNGVPTSLSAQDQDSFFQGHATHTRAATKDIVAFLCDPLEIDGCKNPAQWCSGIRLRALQDHWHSLHTFSHLPLTVWDEDGWYSLDDICPACFTVLKRTHAEARQAFWDGLPEMYGLPPWEELEKMKVAAIGNVVL
ncbi:hypothetical protein FB451DRAFT_1124430 [Mycena latifolia]|nr:hypothetical protein FB451DRAFT_1124430 [Mycena latifolia]